MNDDNIKVRMNGKEYLEYLKYTNGGEKHLKRNQTLGLGIMAVGVVLGLVAYFLTDMWQTKPQEYPTIFIQGIPIPMVMIYLLIISVCIGWVWHGVGFFIVRGK